MAGVFADVLLPLPLQEPFTYAIPAALEEKVLPGTRVAVRFGSRKTYAALVVAIHRTPPSAGRVREIAALLDDRPVAGEQHFRFWKWIAGYYLCSEGEVMKAALPPGMKLESETLIFPVADPPDREVTPEEQQLLLLLGDRKMRIGDLAGLAGNSHSLRLLRQLIEKQVVAVEERVTEKYKPLTRAVVSAGDALAAEGWPEEALAALKRAPRQRELLRQAAGLLAPFTPGAPGLIDKKALLGTGGFTEATLNQLVSKEYLKICQVEVSRLGTAGISAEGPSLPGGSLQMALARLREQFEAHRVVLLHGPSAERTRLCLSLAAGVAATGKQILWLVPEISMTPRLAEYLESLFGGKVGVYHSAGGDAARTEIWHRVRGYDGSDKSCQVVLGTRSALFLPFPDAGLIIVDDEHDPSYKQQDPAPRYHARDTAVVLGTLLSCSVLLASATPSFESYHNARTGKYGLVSLAEETGSLPAPLVVVADIRDARKRKTIKGMFTPALYEAVSDALAQQQQVILFQNRRGYAPYPECSHCGWVPACIRCDVSLSYHKLDNRLICHYCGYSLPFPQECAQCHSPDLLLRGSGTERVEEEVALLFPGARIARIDADTVRTRAAYRRMMDTVANRNADILVGTRMITRGDGFGNVAVVGILNAGSLLNASDFRAFERAFQVMSALRDLAGGTPGRGKLVIQTSVPGHPVTDFLQQNDYEGFYNRFSAERRTFRYPPWFRFMRILVRHRDESRVAEVASFLAVLLRRISRLEVLGPQAPPVSRLRGLHAREIWLKIPREASRNTMVQAVAAALESARNHPRASGISLQPDVDAV